MAVLEAGRLDGRAFSGAAAFRVEIVRDWHAAALRWSGGCHGTAFQNRLWLDAWYRAFETAEPLIAIISDAAIRRDLALVPLVRRVHAGVRVVEFADLDLTDYNAPWLGDAAPRDAAGVRAMGQALIAALRRLPEGADLLRMKKMPAEIGGRPNPFVWLGRIGSCSLNGNLIKVGDDLESYRASIRKMQMPRSWRVFNRYPGASFEIVGRADQALQLLDTMDMQQQARMRAIGARFNLNQGPRARFYRDLVSRGIADGYAVVAALKCDEAVVATMLGIRRDHNFVFLRVSNAGGRWSHCSPSRLIVERTITALHQRGVREFDLSIGNYAFKRRFGAATLPLTDVSIALGWRGVPFVLRDRAAQGLRRYPWLATKMGRVLGKPMRVEE